MEKRVLLFFIKLVLKMLSQDVLFLIPPTTPYCAIK